MKTSIKLPQNSQRQYDSVVIQDLLNYVNECKTAINYRNNGYSRELISQLIEYHKKNSDAIFYLWAENPTAQKIYIEAGFTLMPIQHEAWSAVYSSN